MDDLISIDIKAEDMISRADVIELVKNSYYNLAESMEDTWAMVADVEKLQPAQPDIIACGDCKHWICHDKRCGYWNHGVKPLDWCCHGERRTDEQTD